MQLFNVFDPHEGASASNGDRSYHENVVIHSYDSDEEDKESPDSDFRKRLREPQEEDEDDIATIRTNASELMDAEEIELDADDDDSIEEGMRD